MPIESPTVGLRLDLSPADRDRLRLASAKAGARSMTAYLQGLVLGHLDALDAAEARPARRNPHTRTARP